MKLITICDVESKDGRTEVIDQRDYTVPEVDSIDVYVFCRWCRCDGDCTKCAVTRVFRDGQDGR